MRNLLLVVALCVPTLTNAQGTTFEDVGIIKCEQDKNGKLGLVLDPSIKDNQEAINAAVEHCRGWIAFTNSIGGLQVADPFGFTRQPQQGD